MFKSHDTEHHRVIEPRTNQDGKEYALSTDTVLDTGANDHFFHDKPRENYRVHSGTVRTADGGVATIIGIGTVEVGKLKLERVLHVLLFKRNLVSGPRLMDDGFTLIGRRKKLDISKDGEHICTAHLDAKDRLVKFNQLSVQNFYAPLGEELHVTSAIDVDATANSTEKQMDINIAHQQWGHCGEAMLRRTAKSQYIELFGNMQFCESCILTKSNQLAKKRSSMLVYVATFTL